MRPNQGGDPLTRARRLLDAFTHANLGGDILTLGLFGSSTYIPTASDVDVLLIVETKSNTKRDVSEAMSLVTKRIRGDYRPDMPKDHSVPSEFVKVVEEYAVAEAIEVDSGIGPQQLHHKTDPWIHLNGPMSLLMWNAFCQRHRIHATAILRNLQILHGRKPETEGISRQDVRLYVDDMRARITSQGLSPKYLRKLAKAAALVAGAQKISNDDTAIFLLSQGILSRDQVECLQRMTGPIYDSHSEMQALANYLLDATARIAGAA